MPPFPSVEKALSIGKGGGKDGYPPCARNQFVYTVLPNRLSSPRGDGTPREEGEPIC